MTSIKVGDICKCVRHGLCFFEEGSIVRVTRVKGSLITAELVLGARKPEYHSAFDGGLPCYRSELEVIHDLARES